MTLKKVLAKLKSLGTEKRISQNIKNGAGDNQYGVKLGGIRKIAKEIKKNHELALELWKTQNIDARLLAILILKPKKMSGNELDAMVKSIDFVQVADWFNAYVLKKHPEKESLREKWMNADSKWAARAGWSLTAGKIARDPGGLNLSKVLDHIEAEMPRAAPEVQWTMNTALAKIGINFPEYRKRAIDIGERLGIYRDYPVSKGCTSPFAPIWINEMVSRQEASNP
ncbi:MAG: DNA alkylation repair protein [Balneolaceae bacterium]|nr:DNA alkylation repair protein [Balneolaceae bacterium]